MSRSHSGFFFLLTTSVYDSTNAEVESEGITPWMTNYYTSIIYICIFSIYKKYILVLSVSFHFFCPYIHSRQRILIRVVGVV